MCIKKPIIKNQRCLLEDANRSCLLMSELEKYQSEVVKQRISPICSNSSTFDLCKLGADVMTKDDFHMIKGLIDL